MTWAWCGFFVVDYRDAAGRQGFDLFDHRPAANRFMKKLVAEGGSVLRLLDKNGEEIEHAGTPAQ